MSERKNKSGQPFVTITLTSSRGSQVKYDLVTNKAGVPEQVARIASVFLAELPAEDRRALSNREDG